MRKETKLTLYGRPSMPGPANPSVVRASTIHHETVSSFHETKKRRENDDSVLSYGRRGTTTAHVLAESIADLESAESSFLFPSGLAAMSAAISSVVGSGDHILVVDKVFGATRKFCEEHLAHRNIKAEYYPFDSQDLGPWLRPETKAVVVESPVSRTLEVMDLPAIVQSVAGRDITVIADNTYGSGWLYRPLELGCDVSVISGTKYLGGHADLMMGVASARGNACRQLRSFVHGTGQTLSPDDAYNCLRGMRTLALRMERQGQNSLAVAKWLAGRSEVERVMHPLLENHPGHAVWQRDANGCNGLLAVEFSSVFPVEAFVNGLKLFRIGSSWGGFESLALPFFSDRPTDTDATPSDGKAGPCVRFHVGLEHLDDLIDDLRKAF